MSEPKRRPGRYPDEVRERAVRGCSSTRASTVAVEGDRVDLGEAEYQPRDVAAVGPAGRETDAAQRPGLTTDERARMKQLEREHRELRRANESVKAAAHFFGAELDRQSPR
jgi:transposase